jgi:prepilin-type N-terminal cleavage/methylation domain-containing protein
VPAAEDVDGPRRHQGFTLLEVLVALLIFGLIFAALARIFQTGFQQSSAAEAMATATMLARSQLARIGSDLPLEVGATEEDGGGGFRVRTTIQPAAPETTDDQFVPLLVEVTVFWGPLEGERRVALTTLRLGAAQPEQGR